MEKLLLNLTRAMKAGTPSERKIAKYLIEHLDELPFETAQTLAAKLGLSPMTVGRFLRSLGYRQFSDIRADLRHAEEMGVRSKPHPWQVENSPIRFPSFCHNRSRPSRPLST